MRLLALDLGSRSACIVAEDRKPLVVSEWDCSVRRGESNGVRFLRFRRLLSSVLDEGPVHLVGYEHPGGNIRNGAAAACLLGLVAEVEAACAERGIEYIGINPSRVKLAATGKGGGKGTGKDEMLEAARARWPDLGVESEHVADALWVLECLREEVGSR